MAIILLENYNVILSNYTLRLYSFLCNVEDIANILKMHTPGQPDRKDPFEIAFDVHFIKQPCFIEVMQPHLTSSVFPNICQAYPSKSMAFLWLYSSASFRG